MSHTIELDGKTITVYNVQDIMNSVRPVLVKIEDGQIGFVDHAYWIELSQIKTRRDLIEWIHHMLGKQWVTNEMLEQFIEQVCQYRNWTIYKHV